VDGRGFEKKCISDITPKPFIRKGMCEEVWRGVEWCGEVWSGVGRCGEVWSGVGRCGEVWRGVERCGEVCGGVGLHASGGEGDSLLTSAVGAPAVTRRHLTSFQLILDP